MKKFIMPVLFCLAITGTSMVKAPKPLMPDHAKTERVTAKQGWVSTTDYNEVVELRTFQIKIGNKKEKQVEIQVYRSDVQVVGHNSDEVIIQTSNYNLPERAEGLRSLYSQVADNTRLGLAVIENKNKLKIVQASRRGGSYTIKVPNKVALIYHEANASGGKFNLSETEGEIDIKLHHGSATLTNVSGPVQANSVHGRIDIKFTELNQAKASSINSVHGPIDITLPGNTKADFALKSHHGEIYTDFDLKRASDEKVGLIKVAGRNTINGKANNGGVEMNISAVHSDIFIRKQKP